MSLSDHYCTVARKAEDKQTTQTLHAECSALSQTHSMLGIPMSPRHPKSASLTIRQAPTPFEAPQTPPSSRFQSYLKHHGRHHPARPHSYQSSVSRMRTISIFTSESTLVVCQDTLTSDSMVDLQATQAKVNRPQKPAVTNLAARAARLLICCSNKLVQE